MNKKPSAIGQKQKKQAIGVKGGKKDVKNNIHLSILQTLKHQIDFLSMFTPFQVQFLLDNYDVIVFDRGTILAKQKQQIDYLGVIINGGALGQKSKQKYKKNSFIGHQVSLFGLQGHKHSQTITAQSDGILFAMRIQSLINLTKDQLENSIRTKIISFIAQETLYQLKGERHFRSSIESEFQVMDDKLTLKFQQSSKLLTSLVEVFTDPKQKEKLFQEFPLCCAKEKTLVASRHSRPYFLILLKGEITVKYGLGMKKQSKLLQANQLYNSQGFILDHNQFSNLYCSSNEAVFLIVEKERLVNNFKLLTVSGVLKFLLDYSQKSNDYSLESFLPQSDQVATVEKKEIWSPFKKSFSIQEIPVKKETKVNPKATTVNKTKESINTLQALYQSYSHHTKNKQKSKQTQLTEYKESGEQKHTINTVVKTQYSMDEKVLRGNSGQKIKKLQTDILGLKQQTVSLGDTIKGLRLDLLESQSRLKMIEVFRNINDLKATMQHQSNKLNSEGKSETRSVTLKEAFQIHLKNKKLQLLVAKCAYKWLSITRENKNKIKPLHQSTMTIQSKSQQGIQT